MHNGLQSAGQGFRYGKTEQEQRLLDAFKPLGFNAKSDMIVCFQCGGHFRNLSIGHYPTHCLVCGVKFTDYLQHCMPDIFIENAGIFGTVLVNGKIHERTKKHINRDQHQIELLQFWNYKVFVIKNELIDNAQNAWLRLMAYSIFQAISNVELYNRAHEGEKELVGLGVKRHV